MNERLKKLEKMVSKVESPPAIFITGMSKTPEPTCGFAILMTGEHVGQQVAMDEGETWTDFEARVHAMCLGKEKAK